MWAIIDLMKSATVQDYVIACLIISNLLLWKKSAKFALLNTAVARVCDELWRIGGLRILGSHRNGDYYLVNPFFDHLDERKKKDA